jgi:TetR/AcrR family transcriptional repressor of nem operon
VRYGEGHKDETRSRVLRAASAAVRARGPDGVSVAEVMAQAGLTHGGFYTHFDSKDALVVAAIEDAFAQGRRRFGRQAQGLAPAAALAAFVEAYLSREHRDHPARGCPVSALAGDMARQPAAARAAFDAGVDGMLNGLSRWLPDAEPAARRALAASLLAEMAGAVALSRAVSDDRLADEILSACRTRVRVRAGLSEPAERTAELSGSG